MNQLKRRVLFRLKHFSRFVSKNPNPKTGKISEPSQIPSPKDHVRDMKVLKGRRWSYKQIAMYLAIPGVLILTNYYLFADSTPGTGEYRQAEAEEEKKRAVISSIIRGDSNPNVSLSQRELDGICSAIEYPANNPIEDRYSFWQLTENGTDDTVVVASVFDGHGGWQVSDYVNKNMINRISEQLRDHKFSALNKKLVSKIIEASFDHLEDELLEQARSTYSQGSGKSGRIGSCALTAFIVDKLMAIANAGDCQAVLCRVPEKGSGIVTPLEAVELSVMQNANNPVEQKRLREQFPNDSNIYICKHSRACYVKGRLMPTRSFGDFHLKHKEFNNPNNLNKSAGYLQQMPNFAGPYITHRPEIKFHQIKTQDRYLLLASDGLWDEMTPQHACNIIAQHAPNVAKAAEALKIVALTNAAKDRNMSYDQLMALETTTSGKARRRSIHDDITVVILDLQNLP